jgi:hypothetical protein
MEWSETFDRLVSTCTFARWPFCRFRILVIHKIRYTWPTEMYYLHSRSMRKHKR